MSTFRFVALGMVAAYPPLGHYQRLQTETPRGVSKLESATSPPAQTGHEVGVRVDVSPIEVA
jgi:hypothetical protein